MPLCVTKRMSLASKGTRDARTDFCPVKRGSASIAQNSQLILYYKFQGLPFCRINSNFFAKIDSCSSKICSYIPLLVECLPFHECSHWQPPPCPDFQTLYKKGGGRRRKGVGKRIIREKGKGGLPYVGKGRMELTLKAIFSPEVISDTLNISVKIAVRY